MIRMLVELGHCAKLRDAPAPPVIYIVSSLLCPHLISPASINQFLSFPAMSSTTPIPPGVHIHASRQPELYAADITTYVLAVIAIALRFWARKLMKTKLWWDDWIIAGALVRSQDDAGSAIFRILTAPVVGSYRISYRRFLLWVLPATQTSVFQIPGC